MNINKYLLVFITLFVTTLGCKNTASANTITPSQQHPEIEIRAWLKSDDVNQGPLVVAQKEQVVMVIEVATPRWFTAGTQISLPEINHAIVMQRNAFAINLTERRSGQTWAKQQWEITLYPLQSGQFTIPPTRVEVAFSSRTGGNKYATLYTAPLSFEVHLPDAQFTQSSQWFTASSASVEQEWQLVFQDEQSQQLSVGDSVSRTVTLKASDSLSILLPSILPSHSTHAYQRYSAPNQLTDDQVRGRYFSSRTEHQTYLLQQGGEFVLPDYEVLWWNPESKRVKHLKIEGKTLQVSHTWSSFMTQYWRQIIALTLFIVVASLSVSLTYRYYSRHPLPEALQFALAINKKDLGQARKLAYQRAKRNHQSDTLNDLSDNSQWVKQASDFQTQETNKHCAQQIWQRVSINRNRSALRQGFRLPKMLKRLSRHH
ncbi:BatD family protein [Vibrio astriarenae]